MQPVRRAPSTRRARPPRRSPDPGRPLTTCSRRLWATASVMSKCGQAARARSTTAARRRSAAAPRAVGLDPPAEPAGVGPVGRSPRRCPRLRGWSQGPSGQDRCAAGCRRAPHRHQAGVAIVEDQQQAPGRQEVGERAHQPPGGGVLKPQGTSHRLGHQGRIAQVGELSHPHAVGECPPKFGPARSASRVFPTPAGPTRVSRAVEDSAFLTLRSSRRRPMKLVSSRGMPFPRGWAAGRVTSRRA
jgi:hypothetical protein